MAKSGYEVLIKIIADAGKAKAEFDRAGAAAERMAKRTESEVEKSRISMQKMGKQAAITGGVMLAAGGAMALALRGTVKSAQEAETAQLQLQNTIRGSKALGADAMAAFEGQAKALQKYTVASDEAVMGVQSMLGQFGMTKQEVLTLTPLVVDVSRKLGIDYVGAAKAVGKAAEGSTGALKKMGIIVDQAKAKVDPFGATVDALRRAAGGFAATEGKTFAGQMAILSNQADELKESVGRGVLSVMSSLVPVAVNVGNAFNSVNESTGNLVGSMLALGTGFTLVVGGGLTAISTFVKLKETYDKLAESSKAMQMASSAAPYVAVAAVAVVAGMKIGEAILGGAKMADKGYSDTFSAKNGKLKMQAFLGAAEGEARKGATSLSTLASITGKALIGTAIGGPAGTVIGLVKGIDDAAKNLTKSGIDKAFKKVLTLDPGSAQSILDYIGSHKRLRDQLVSMGVPLAEYRKLVKDTVDTNHDGKQSIEEKINALGRESQAAQDLANTYASMGSVERNVQESRLGVVRAQDDLVKAQKEYNDAVQSGDPAKVHDAQLALQGALLAVGGAQDAARDAALKHAEMLLKLQTIANDGKAYAGAIEHLKELQSVLTDPAEVQALQDQINLIVEKHLLLGKKVDLNDPAVLTALAQLHDQGKLTNEQLDNVARTRTINAPDVTPLTGPLDAIIGKAKEASGLLSGLNVSALGAANDVAKYLQAYNTLHLAHPDWSPENINAYLRMNPNLTRASGGPVAGGTMYLVGEQGPEMFVAPPSGGRIIPNHALRGAMTSSMDGTASVVINVTASPLAAPADTGAAILDALKAYERRNGRLPLKVG